MLHDGAIAEMKTGEGKTLVSTLAAYLNALSGEGVHGILFLDFLLVETLLTAKGCITTYSLQMWVLDNTNRYDFE